MTIKRKVKKSQCSIYLPDDMLQAIKERAKLNFQTISGVIEQMLVRQFQRELENQKKAIAMAEQGTMRPVEPTPSGSDESS